MLSVGRFVISYFAQAPATDRTGRVYALAIVPVLSPIMIASGVICASSGAWGLFLDRHNPDTRTLLCCSGSLTRTNFSTLSRLYHVGAVTFSLDTIKKRSVTNTSQFSNGSMRSFRYMRSTFKGLFGFIFCITLRALWVLNNPPGKYC